MHVLYSVSCEATPAAPGQVLAEGQHVTDFLSGSSCGNRRSLNVPLGASVLN